MRSLFFVCLALLFVSAMCDDVATTGNQRTQQQSTGSGQVLPGSPDADTTYVFSDVDEEEG